MSQRLPEEWFIEDTRTNAAIAWLFAAGIAVSGIGNFLAGELVTAIGAGVAVAVAIVPAWVERSWQYTIPWPLLALSVLPFALNAVGLVFVAKFVGGIAVATLALLVVVALQLTMSVRMTPSFAVWFAVIATLGIAGIWAFGSWLSATYLDTTFFETNSELMMFFLTTLVAGLVAAGVFVWYFRRRLRANLDEQSAVGGVT